MDKKQIMIIFFTFDAAQNQNSRHFDIVFYIFYII